MLLLKCLPQLQAKMNASSKGGARGTWVQTLKSAEVPFPLSLLLVFKMGLPILPLGVVESVGNGCQASSSLAYSSPKQKAAIHTTTHGMWHRER